MAVWRIPPVLCKAVQQPFDLPAEPAEYLQSLAQADRPFFLDSAAQHPRWAQFSYLGCDPLLSLTFSSPGPARLEFAHGLPGRVRRRDLAQNPFHALEQLSQALTLANPLAPDQFAGGLVGYFSYDLGRYIERLPSFACSDIALPELCLNLYDCWAAYDHSTGRWSLAALEFPKGSWLDRGQSPTEKMDRLAALLTADTTELTDWPTTGHSTDSPQCNFTPEQYLWAVRRARDYIGAGDIFQVNLSQRFTVDLQCHPLQAYLQLRRISPAWFAAYLQMPGRAILSSSPELFLRRRGQTVITRPIKGTRPRRGQPDHDLRMRHELSKSIKDAAELNMIVDLERNDLGRVCKYGSVRVAQHRQMEEHPTVFHLVSTVTGQLTPQTSTVDLLRATFPGGSISGAPKVRAMEIIEELEPTRRSVYTGAIGYIGLDGSCQLNIAIRTIIVDGPRAHCQVGGAVVADSDPDAEYQETLDKGLAMMAALRNMPLSQLVFK